MEESSSNPYIPGQSENIRKKVNERQSPLGRIVKWALIATAVVAVLVGGGLFFVIPRTTADDHKGRTNLADVLQPPDQTLKRVDVSSQLGFRLNYDNRVYDSHAEVGADDTAGTDADNASVSGQAYDNNDLRTGRAYNYVRIRPIESADTARAFVPIPPQLEIFATVSTKDLTSAAAVPENKNLSQLSLFVKLDSDKRLAKKIADDKTVVTIESTKPVTATINKIDYQKVRYTTTNDNYRISDVKYDDCYYTIQNDQPYAVCVSGVRPTNQSQASLVENIFNSLTFQQPSSIDGGASTTDGKKTSFLYPLARLTQATTSGGDSSNGSSGSSSSDGSDTSDSGSGDSSESSLLTFHPDYYDNADSLKAIAKTQPAVVRIGTLYCANLSLKYESGDTAATISDACVGNVATGVAISKDGYIATSGHAILNQKKAAIGGYINFAPNQDAMTDRLQTILDYLLKSKFILQSDADYLKTGAQTGDQEALAKIENIGSVIKDDYISAVNENYTYAVQPTDKPIVVNKTDGSKPSFAYSDTVLEAKFVGADYDATKSVQTAFAGVTPSVDTGLLKVNANFQDIAIAPKQTVKGNDTINIIGFPAYEDSGLAIDKIRNQPIVTSTKVDQVYKKDKGTLIQTDDPVLPGNDGAPVVDASGQLIGFAVYGLSYCPDQQCLANGTVRPATELLTLLDEQNVKLKTGSEATKSWNEGIDQYFRANYTPAASAFAASATLYPFNVWAQPLQKLAAGNEGNASDTSLMNVLQTVMIVVLIILVVVTILLAIAEFIHKKSINSMQVGHYGAAEAALNPTFTPAPVPTQPLDLLPPLPTQQVPSVDIAVPTVQPSPQIMAPSESPALPIRDQSAAIPGAVQPQQVIRPPTPRIEAPTPQPLADPNKSVEPKDSFYS